MKKVLLELVTQIVVDKEKAWKFIRSGQVFINQNIAFAPFEKFENDSVITIKKSKTWVSRGAIKLLSALKEFKIDVNGFNVLDIGSSTGGFTQVLLSQGAKKVNALDVGTNQLDYKLRVDSRVNVFEKTNLKTITPAMFNEHIDLVVVDVSFISLEHVFKVVEKLANKNIIALIKPQFEANSYQVHDGGFVPQNLHREIINKVILFAKKYMFKLIKLKKSPITGVKSKNIEYLALFERS